MLLGVHLQPAGSLRVSVPGTHASRRADGGKDERTLSSRLNPRRRRGHDRHGGSLRAIVGADRAQQFRRHTARHATDDHAPRHRRGIADTHRVVDHGLRQARHRARWLHLARRSRGPARQHGASPRPIAIATGASMPTSSSASGATTKAPASNSRHAHAGLRQEPCAGTSSRKKSDSAWPYCCPPTHSELLWLPFSMSSSRFGATHAS